MTNIIAPSVQDAENARDRSATAVLMTPLVPLLDCNGDLVCRLKLECLQPTGSFKVRGAANAIRLAASHGASAVYTASAGNMAAAAAYAAGRDGIALTAVVPENAPRTKIRNIERFGGETTSVPYDEWWNVLVEHRWQRLVDVPFIHPFADSDVIAGNGTLALELIEQCPEIETILCSYGGGGLVSGVAAVLKALKPTVSVVVAEVEVAAPLSGATHAGHPIEVPYTPTFVDGCGARSVVPEMWALVSGMVDDVVTVTLQEVVDAIHLLADSANVIAEGAGAVPVAAVCRTQFDPATTVCVVSGGNIDQEKLVLALAGSLPDKTHD